MLKLRGVSVDASLLAEAQVNSVLAPGVTMDQGIRYRTISDGTNSLPSTFFNKVTVDRPVVPLFFR